MKRTQKLGLDSSIDTEEQLQHARDEAVATFAARVWQSRFGWLIVPFGLAVLLFLGDWAGHRGSNMPRGDPKPLAEIWWHFPLHFAATTVVYLWFGPRKRD